MDILGMPGGQVGMLDLSEILGAKGKPTKRKKRVKAALETVMEEEADTRLDQDNFQADAIAGVENNGIVFIDEIDKIAISEMRSGGAVSREGVQRDLLPELQGRMPIRVELAALTKDDFRRILADTEHSLLKQYRALMATEGLTLKFSEEDIDHLATVSFDIKESVENIGARRLATVMERLLEEISFTAPDRGGETILIDRALVDERVGTLRDQADLSRFIL